ncbi:MAG: class I SAM-dependent methyltransferase [Acuticoccus sp.]
MSLMEAPRPAAAPDLVAVKERQQMMWSAGDYSMVGVTLQIVGENLAEALDLIPGERVLDVAAGNGNATLAAARRQCNVVSSDYVAAWLADGKARADAEALPVAFEEADAENLPFGAGMFDVVTSTFGVMFTANQEKAAAELARVTRSGGRIGLANWTPQGFIGTVFKTIGRHMQPPAGVRSPAEWGTEARLHELFRDTAQQIRIERRQFVFRYPSAEAWIDSWRQIYGPLAKAFDGLGEPAKQAALRADLIAVAGAASRSSRAMIVPGEYLEVVITRA